MPQIPPPKALKKHTSGSQGPPRIRHFHGAPPGWPISHPALELWGSSEPRAQAGPPTLARGATQKSKPLPNQRRYLFQRDDCSRRTYNAGLASLQHELGHSGARALRSNRSILAKLHEPPGEHTTRARRTYMLGFANPQNLVWRTYMMGSPTGKNKRGRGTRRRRRRRRWRRRRRRKQGRGGGRCGVE